MKITRLYCKLILATLIALSALMLGAYAIYRSYTDEKIVYLIEGITPFFLGGWGLMTLMRFWIAIFKNGNSHDKDHN